MAAVQFLAHRSLFHDDRAMTTLVSAVSLVALIIAVVSGATNMLLTLATVTAAIAICLLLGSRRFAPVLVFVCLAQWLQASADTWHANFLRVHVNDLFASWSVDDATLLSLLAVVVLAAGMRISLIGFRTRYDSSALEAAQRFSVERVFMLYVGVAVLCVALHAVAFEVPRFSQVLIGFISIRWVMFFLLAATVICQRRNYGVLAFAIVFELIVGATGFFSTFKTVFLVFLLAVVSIRQQRTGRLVGFGAAAVVALVLLGVVWSAIKVDYRNYVNHGTRQQVVAVPVSERLTKMASMLVDLEWQDMQSGTQRLVERLGYVQYFAYVLDNVPANIPHEQGRLWTDSLRHIGAPRLLFPDKKALPLDTEITERYTQRRIIAQSTRFTNIPIGYVGESYIDFGRWLMFAPMLLLGITIGGIYRFVMRNSTNSLLRVAFVTVMFMEFNRLELSSPKLLGGVGVSVIVLSAVMWLVTEPLMNYLDPDRKFKSLTPRRSLIE